MMFLFFKKSQEPSLFSLFTTVVLLQMILDETQCFSIQTSNSRKPPSCSNLVVRSSFSYEDIMTRNGSNQNNFQLQMSSIDNSNDEREVNPTPPKSTPSSTNGNNDQDNNDEITKQKKREQVMSFLRKVGAVGNKKDFATAIGVDEGPVGKNNEPVKELEKSKAAYKWCSETGIIDDMTESFPLTSSGSEWAGFTDAVMGGVSTGICTRETINGRVCNLMKGKVSLYNNGGFIQMATALSTNPAVSLTVDASKFDGVELDILYKGDEDEERFNIHIRNRACFRYDSSYRGTFSVKNDNDWETVRIPFSEFVGYGPGSSEIPFDTSELGRLGIVAIGKQMDVYLAIAGVRFYKDF